METTNGVNGVKRLENRIARLERRAKQLERVSNKYWTTRRILFVCGVLLSVFSCRYSGQLGAWICAAAFIIIFFVVAAYHRKVRDSIARNALMLDIKISWIVFIPQLSKTIHEATRNITKQY